MRREETTPYAIRLTQQRFSQDSPMLMWLRKLEVLNKVATSGKLNFVLGEKGLAERVVNLRCMNPMPGARKRFRPPGFLLAPDLASAYLRGEADLMLKRQY